MHRIHFRNPNAQKSMPDTLLQSHKCVNFKSEKPKVQLWIEVWMCTGALVQIPIHFVNLESYTFLGLVSPKTNAYKSVYEESHSSPPYVEILIYVNFAAHTKTYCRC